MFDFDLNGLAARAVDAHPQGLAIMQPGLLYPGHRLPSSP